MKYEKGQATVELALSMVLLTVILFAIIDFGRIFHVYLTLEHASREAARVASVGGTDVDVIQRAKTSASTLDSNDIVVSVTPDRSRGTYATVQLQYPFSFSIPLLGNVLPDPLMLKAKTVMRIE